MEPWLSVEDVCLRHYLCVDGERVNGEDQCRGPAAVEEGQGAADVAHVVPRVQLSQLRLHGLPRTTRAETRDESRYWATRMKGLRVMRWAGLPTHLLQHLAVGGAGCPHDAVDLPEHLHVPHVPRAQLGPP